MTPPIANNVEQSWLRGPKAASQVDRASGDTTGAVRQATR